MTDFELVSFHSRSHGRCLWSSFITRQSVCRVAYLAATEENSMYGRASRFLPNVLVAWLTQIKTMSGNFAWMLRQSSHTPLTASRRTVIQSIISLFHPGP